MTPTDTSELLAKREAMARQKPYSPEWCSARVAYQNALVNANDLLNAVEGAHERERAFSEALGFGDDATEPAASLEEMVEPIQFAFQDAHDHDECPKYCELCGERFADVRCVKCSGSGCLWNPQLAHLECDECAGSGWIHEGCTQMSYEDMAAQLAAPDLLNELDQLRGQVARVEAWYGWRRGTDAPNEALAIPAEGGE